MLGNCYEHCRVTDAPPAESSKLSESEVKVTDSEVKESGGVKESSGVKESGGAKVLVASSGENSVLVTKESAESAKEAASREKEKDGTKDSQQEASNASLPNSTRDPTTEAQTEGRSSTEDGSQGHREQFTADSAVEASSEKGAVAEESEAGGGEDTAPLVNGSPELLERGAVLEASEVEDTAPLVSSSPVDSSVNQAGPAEGENQDTTPLMAGSETSTSVPVQVALEGNTPLVISSLGGSPSLEEGSIRDTTPLVNGSPLEHGRTLLEQDN